MDLDENIQNIKTSKFNIFCFTFMWILINSSISKDNFIVSLIFILIILMMILMMLANAYFLIISPYSIFVDDSNTIKFESWTRHFELRIKDIMYITHFKQSWYANPYIVYGSIKHQNGRLYLLNKEEILKFWVDAINNPKFKKYVIKN